MKIRSGARRAIASLMIGCLVWPGVLWAQTGAVDEQPDPYAMVADLVVARPLGVVLTAGGVAVWLVSLPFTLLSGSVNEAAETLIAGPAEATFVRCLGCRNPGYTYKDIEHNRQQKEEAAASGADPQ